MFENIADFERCCEMPSIQSYEIQHSPRPIILVKELDKCLEWLLWYAPHNKSIQSIKNDILGRDIFNQFIFEKLIASLQMKNSDILVADSSTIANLEHNFSKEICTKCQKIIMTKSVKCTYTMEMLRHIRNVIAHGRFNLVNDMLIGFDFDRDRITAIIKIYPKLLYKSILLLNDWLESALAQAKLVQLALEELGYVTEVGSGFYDLTVSKEGRRYLLIFKSYPKMQFIPLRNIEDYIISPELRDHFTSIDYESLTRQELKTQIVYIVDTSKITKEGLKKVIEIGVRVLDKKSINELLKGKDVLEHNLV